MFILKLNHSTNVFATANTLQPLPSKRLSKWGNTSASIIHTRERNVGETEVLQRNKAELLSVKYIILEKSCNS